MSVAERTTKLREAFLRLTLRRKFLGLTVGSAGLVTAILTIAFYVQMKNVLIDELRLRGEVTAVELSNNLAFMTFSGDRVGLDRAAKATLRDVEGVAFVVLRGAKGEVLASANEAALQRFSADTLKVPDVEGRVKSDERLEGGVSVLMSTAPVMFEVQQSAEADPLDPLGLETAAAKRVPATRSKVGMVQVGLRLDGSYQKLSNVLYRALAVSLVVLVGCALVALLIARMLSVPLEKLSLAAGGIASGDLRQQITAHSGDEIGDLARSFETMSTGLRSLLGDLHAAATDLRREAQSILSTASQQAAMASEHAASVSETSATATQISQTSQKAASYAESVIAVTEKAEEMSRAGATAVEQSVEGIAKLADQVRAIAGSITELSDRTLQIGDIITTVKDVAEQSNMLALNASIEAAKAGEHGKGFAVVAMEMRNLTEQSRAAAMQVRGMLLEVQKGTRAAVAATEEGSRRASAAIDLAVSAGQTIASLTKMSRETASAARQIANDTRQQTAGVEQIVTAITEQSAAVTDTVEGTRQIEKVANHLSQLSNRLSELVSRYRV